MRNTNEKDPRIMGALNAIRYHVVSRTDDYIEGLQLITDLNLLLNAPLNASTQSELSALLCLAINRAPRDRVCHDLIVTLRAHKALMDDDFKAALSEYDGSDRPRTTPQRAWRYRGPGLQLA